MALSNKDETIHGGDDYDDDDDDAKINLRISTDSCRRRKNDAYQPLYIRVSWNSVNPFLSTSSAIDLQIFKW